MWKYNGFGMLLRLISVALSLCVLLSTQALAQASPTPSARQEIRFGILAYRPKPIATSQWEPLVAYLNQAIPDVHFSMRVLGFPEMEAAVDKREVDVVLTNSSHYVQMNYRNGLSSPLVTLVNQEDGVPLSTFGGVIAVLADRKDIRTLNDLQGKRISTPSIKSFGGYLVAAYELQKAGLPQPQASQLIQTGMPHDRAIEQVLAGQADAAFVRTSVLEKMISEGKIKAGQLRVINQQKSPDFPFALSTRLYPEWPVAALPHLERDIANKIAVALLQLPHEGGLAKIMGIHGFDVPMDYHVVAELLKDLRQPPFDVAPSFNASDIWSQYRLQIVIIAFLVGSVILLVVMLAFYSRRLREQRLRAQVGDARLREFSEQLPGVLYEYCLTPDGRSYYPYASEKASQIMGVSPELLAESAENFYSRLHPDDVQEFMERIRESARTLLGWKAEYRVILPDEKIHWREGRAWPQRQADGSTLWHGFVADIDDRREKDEKSALLIAALEASANAIAITDLNASVEWVNQAFCDLTGYERDELIGQNPRVFQSGKHDPAFYREMWDTLTAGKVWRGEIINRRKDGKLSEEELIIAPVKNEKGEVHHYIGVKQGIAERKRLEEELRRQATTDMLTGLPNRRHFFDRAAGELARIKRGRTGVAAVIMFDIDHFKDINDAHGHAVGDEVLCSLADVTTASLRRSDFPGRIGGEEFVVLLPETSKAQGYQFAERLRHMLEASLVETDVGDIRYTASFGLTTLRADDTNIDVALARADQALYLAKAAGRNRVVTAADS